MTRDMIKKKKQGFSFMLQKCKIWHFLKITVLTFFIISPVIFGLQRCTLSQIKALEILFWPCFIIFSPRINICWAIMSRSCQRFFYSPFSSKKDIFGFLGFSKKVRNVCRKGQKSKNELTHLHFGQKHPFTQEIRSLAQKLSILT